MELIVTTAQSENDARPNLLAGKVIASCFLRPPPAASRLKQRCKNWADRSSASRWQNTSLGQKGETLSDSIRVISSYTDAVVMLHPEGAARLATEFSSVPVINGGDGSSQHPTRPARSV